MPFSERYGYVHREIQIESIDEALWAGLWNTFLVQVWEQQSIASMKELCRHTWEEFFKGHRDVFDTTYDDIAGFRHTQFLHDIKNLLRNDHWYTIYDFLEFTLSNRLSIRMERDFILLCNIQLESHKSAYRFVNRIITPIISDIEIDSIESSASIGGPVDIQLRSALEKLSDRQTPDYRNSVKESICAVESQARRIMGDKNATLGKLLIRMERELGLPTPVKEAFSTLYGYTSGSSGVRHGPAEAEKMEVNFDLAKFMLVACSAFINFAATLGEPHKWDE